MQKHKFNTRTETKSSLSRQVVERQKDEHEARGARLPQRDPFEPLISGIGDASSAGVHASMLNRATNGRPSRAGQSLLRLQRQYGNRYVQKVLALAGKGTGEAEAAPDVEQAIQHTRGGGQALDREVRSQMEPAFGADFSGVRVHTGAQSDTLNRELNARAFTTGQDIFFRQDAYNPGNSSGRELIAHELTHVVQQNGDKVQRKLTVGQPGDEYEQEADQVARAVIQHEQRAVQRESDEGLVRRQQVEEEEEEVQMKSEYSRVQRQVEEEEEEELVQPKMKDACIQRQMEEEEIQANRELTDIQSQEEEQEKPLQTKQESIDVRRRIEEEEEEGTEPSDAVLSMVRHQHGNRFAPRIIESPRKDMGRGEILPKVEQRISLKRHDGQAVEIKRRSEEVKDRIDRAEDADGMKRIYRRYLEAMCEKVREHNLEGRIKDFAIWLSYKNYIRKGAFMDAGKRDNAAFSDAFHEFASSVSARLISDLTANPSVGLDIWLSQRKIDYLKFRYMKNIEEKLFAAWKRTRGKTAAEEKYENWLNKIWDKNKSENRGDISQQLSWLLKTQSRGHARLIRMAFKYNVFSELFEEKKEKQEKQRLSNRIVFLTPSVFGSVMKSIWKELINEMLNDPTKGLEAWNIVLAKHYELIERNRELKSYKDEIESSMLQAYVAAEVGGLKEKKISVSKEKLFEFGNISIRPYLISYLNEFKEGVNQGVIEWGEEFPKVEDWEAIVANSSAIGGAWFYADETEGRTDLVMALYGPDSETKLIARDDDSGTGWNAKIAADLSTGTYYVRVEHYNSQSGTGAYSIKVVK